MAYNENFSADTKSLGKILKMVRDDRNLGLPIFQRPLVWDNTKKLELLMSVLNGDPIGSLLWVEVSQKDISGYSPREFQSANTLDLTDEVTLVVDGQQRLSALLDIVNSKLRKRRDAKKTWAVDIDIQGILDSGEFELRHHLSLKSGLAPSVDIQASKGVMRAELLVDSTMRGTWQAKFKESRGWSDDELKEKMGSLPPGFIHGIDQFDIPVITLTRQNTLSQVLEYFEKLNTKGEPLVAFDIVHSRMSNQGGGGSAAYDLRSITTGALEKSPALLKLGISPEKSDDLMLPLQLLAARVMAPNKDLGDAAAKQTSDVSNGSILSLPPSAIAGGSSGHGLTIEEAVANLERAADFLHDQCGVVSPRLLPQKSMLIPIADQMWSKEKGLPHVSMLDLRRWFYCLCLQGEFHGRTKSSAVKHVKELHNWSNQGLLPEVISLTDRSYVKNKVDFSEQFKDEPKIICTPALAMIVAEGGKDWSKSGKKVSSLNEVEIHHICPEGTLIDLGIPAGQRWCVANLTPIGAETNNQIKKKPPSEVFPTGEWTAQQRAEVLRGHLVNPANFDKKWTKARYEALVKARAAAMTDFVIQTLGL